jgi:hypothetical protein
MSVFELMSLGSSIEVVFDPLDMHCLSAAMLVEWPPARIISSCPLFAIWKVGLGELGDHGEPRSPTITNYV